MLSQPVSAMKMLLKVEVAVSFFIDLYFKVYDLIFLFYVAITAEKSLCPLTDFCFGRLLQMENLVDSFFN